MRGFLIRRWKLLLTTFALLILAGAGLLGWRVNSFVGDTTGGGRTSGYLEATPAQSSVIEINQAEQFQATSGTGTPLIVPTTAPTPTQASFSNVAIVQKLKKGTPLTMMLVGYGGNGHAGEWLTDTILLLRYDPSTKTVLQLNIPRDLYVYVPYGGKNKGSWGKINDILPSIMYWDKPNQTSLDPRYRWPNPQKQFDSGINLLADTVEMVTGFRIDYWSTMSFEGFRRFIDAMGGVDVTVERSFIDRKYPRNDNELIDASYMTVEFKSGPQRMSGERAIEYARSRYSENPEEMGDFARSKRQMNLINAVKAQALKDNLMLKGLNYMQALQGQIRFSLDFGELVSLANYFNSAEGKSLLTDLKFDSKVMNDRFLINQKQGDSYILVPQEGQGKYAAIQRWLYFAILGAGAKTSEAKVQILNGNGQAGLAGKFTDFLLEQKFNMLEEQDGENRPDTVVFDYTGGKADSIIARLKTYLPNLKVLPTPPSQRPKNAPPEVDLQLCLGKDFRWSASFGAGNKGN